MACITLTEEKEIIQDGFVTFSLAPLSVCLLTQTQVSNSIFRTLFGIHNLWGLLAESHTGMLYKMQSESIRELSDELERLFTGYQY